jgi:predicted nucleic acid-binding protein
MNIVFLDTVGLLAIWDRADQWHSAATVAFTKLASAGSKLVTTGAVLLECGNAASRKPFRPAVHRLRHELQSKGQIFDPTTIELESAWTLFRHGNTGSAGVVDLISFEIMRRLNIVDVFTNDQHFKTAGFNALF